MRHMLLQDALLGDLGWQVIWGLCRAASRGAPGRRTSGAKRKYSERSRRHSCRLSSSVTVRATYPMLGGVVMLACNQQSSVGLVFAYTFGLGHVGVLRGYRNREHHPTVRCAMFNIYLPLRRLGREKVISLRSATSSSRSGRRLAGR